MNVLQFPALAVMAFCREKTGCGRLSPAWLGRMAVIIVALGNIGSLSTPATGLAAY